MGKVLVNGFAEQDYEPDYGSITLTVESVSFRIELLMIRSDNVQIKRSQFVLAEERNR